MPTRLSFAIAKSDCFKVVFSDGSVVEGPAEDREAAVQAVSRALHKRAQQDQSGQTEGVAPTGVDRSATQGARQWK